jgi:hypothetical protein
MKPTRVIAKASDGPTANTAALAAEAPAAEPHHERPVDPRATFAAWLKHHVAPGAEVVDEAGAPLKVVYVAKKGDTLASVARANLDLTETYVWDDFAKDIVKANPHVRAGVKEGQRIEIPNLIDRPYKTGDDARLGWPSDKALRGLYLRGATGGGHAYTKILDKMAERGINAIVLDTKDTDGLLTYRSKVPLALEVQATKSAAIADLPRAIRFAHARGIRVVMRISCFHDEWMQHHKPSLSIRGKWGGVYPIGWLEPSSEGAHQYIVDLAREAMDAGADEIELDYVRYPVIGIKNADFHLEERHLTKVEVIRNFVRQVHQVTRPRDVPLSLDIFGVVATGMREDIEMLGQDIAMLGPECEALSPMVYPSHYSKGYMGFEIPGNHPELVGIGTKGTLTQLATAKVPTETVVRPWVQAMNYESPEYGPQYLAKELKSALENGSHGWLMWNPNQDYGYAWQAVPKIVKPEADRAPAPAAKHEASGGVSANGARVRAAEGRAKKAL